MSDNIVLLSTDMKDEVKRTLRIIKTRASQHDPGLHALEISEKGLRILPVVLGETRGDRARRG